MFDIIYLTVLLAERPSALPKENPLDIQSANMDKHTHGLVDSSFLFGYNN